MLFKALQLDSIKKGSYTDSFKPSVIFFWGKSKVRNTKYHPEN